MKPSALVLSFALPFVGLGVWSAGCGSDTTSGGGGSGSTTSGGGSGGNVGNGGSMGNGGEGTGGKMTPKGSCAQPGDKGNDNGVGQYCTPGGGQCSKFPKASICLADLQQDQWFCTDVGCQTNTDCGNDATCVMQGGSACVPNKCLGTGGGGAGGSTGQGGAGGAGGTGGSIGNGGSGGIPHP